jgi:hypothetical protein
MLDLHMFNLPHSAIRRVGVNNRFPAFAAVIRAKQIALVTTGQTSQFLNRMLAEGRGIALLLPLRLEFSRLSRCHDRPSLSEYHHISNLVSMVNGTMAQ